METLRLICMGIAIFFGWNSTEALAQKYNVSPLVVDFYLNESKNIKSVLVENTSDEDLQFTTSTYRVSSTEDGQVIKSEDDPPLLIFPSQFALSPGDAQTIQVRNLSNESNAFFLKIEQILINALEEGSTGVNLTFNFEVLMRVFADKQAINANLILEKGVDGPNLIVENNSPNIHALNDYRLLHNSKKGGDGGYSLKDFDMGQTSLISPGARRKILLAPDVANALADASKLELKYVGPKK